MGVSSMLGPDFAVSLEEMDKQFQDLKLSDLTRQDFISDLIQQMRQIYTEHQNTTKALRAKETLADTYQDQYESAQKEIEALRKATDCSKFVLVLIDGDDTLFEDSYVSAKYEGGVRAARDLSKALFSHFKDKQYFKHDYTVVTKIYLKLGGLSRTYCDANIISETGAFLEFVQGFNDTYDHMHIIDAGKGKEGADTKIKAEFALFQRNLHCQQVVLACSGDNSYGGLLRGCNLVSGKSDKVTLIEALPFVQEIRVQSSNFDCIRFDKLFRNTKIVVGGVSSHDNLNTQSSPMLATMTNNKKSSTISPPTYAAKATSHPKTETLAGSATQDKTSITGSISRYIWVNDLNQRVDRQINNLDRELAHSLKARKLCNNFHLLKKCNFVDCIHKHGPTLGDVELEHLRYVARLAVCKNGFDCRNPDCVSGHRCQNGVTCQYREARSCNFSDEMHKVDLRKCRQVSV